MFISHADVASAYVTNHKYLEECTISDCDSPLAIMTKKEEEKKVRIIAYLYS